MKQLIALVLIVALAQPALAEDLEALEHLRKDLVDDQMKFAAGLVILGTVTAIYGVLQWKDANQVEEEFHDAGLNVDANKGRYVMLTCGGAAAAMLGISCLNSILRGDSGEGPRAFRDGHRKD